MVFLYGIVWIYIYSLLAFAFYREIFDDPASGNFCGTMYECMTTALHGGFIVGFYEVYMINLYLNDNLS